MQLRPAVALPGMAMLAACSVPAPTSIVEVPAVGEVIVMAPLTFSRIPELIVMPLVPPPLAEIVMVDAAAPAVTVTV